MSFQIFIVLFFSPWITKGEFLKDLQSALIQQFTVTIKKRCLRLIPSLLKPYDGFVWRTGWNKWNLTVHWSLASTVRQLYVVLNGKLTCLISFKASNFVFHRRKSHDFVATWSWVNYSFFLCFYITHLTCPLLFVMFVGAYYWASEGTEG